MGVLWMPKNRFEVVNETGQTIRGLTVKVSDRTIRFGDLKPGSSVSAFFYTPDDETYFEIQCVTDAGTPIREAVEYFAWEEYFEYQVLVIRPDGMVDCRR
jgi:hypothetical protein